VSGGVQEPPQSCIPPHSSTKVPHSAPIDAHVIVGVQPHWLGVPPPPQTVGSMHPPQNSPTPHSSTMVPHVAPNDSHVSVDLQPHTFSRPPPPQVLGAVQVPQLTVV